MTYNVQKNWKGKILRIWITLIRHGGLGHEVQTVQDLVRNSGGFRFLKC